jgi:hypothetical protein
MIAAGSPLTDEVAGKPFVDCRSYRRDYDVLDRVEERTRIVLERNRHSEGDTADLGNTAVVVKMGKLTGLHPNALGQPLATGNLIPSQVCYDPPSAVAQ